MKTTRHRDPYCLVPFEPPKSLTAIKEIYNTSHHRTQNAYLRAIGDAVRAQNTDYSSNRLIEPARDLIHPMVQEATQTEMSLELYKELISATTQSRSAGLMENILTHFKQRNRNLKEAEEAHIFYLTHLTHLLHLMPIEETHSKQREIIQATLFALRNHPRFTQNQWMPSFSTNSQSPLLAIYLSSIPSDEPDPNECFRKSQRLVTTACRKLTPSNQIELKRQAAQYLNQ